MKQGRRDTGQDRNKEANAARRQEWPLPPPRTTYPPLSGGRCFIHRRGVGGGGNDTKVTAEAAQCFFVADVCFGGGHYFVNELQRCGGGSAVFICRRCLVLGLGKTPHFIHVFSNFNFTLI